MKKITVIGLGDFGKALVKRLNADGHEVTAIDIDLKTIKDIKDHCTHAVCMDSTDEVSLLAQGIRDMDLVYLTSSANFEALILTTKILEKYCPKERIIVRYRNEIQKEILQRLFNIHKIFNPEEEAAENMALLARHKSIGKSYSVFGNYEIIEFKAPYDFINKKVTEIKIRENYNLNLLLIKREEEGTMKEILINPNMVVKENDLIYLFGTKEHITNFINKVKIS